MAAHCLATQPLWRRLAQDGEWVNGRFFKYRSCRKCGLEAYLCKGLCRGCEWWVGPRGSRGGQQSREKRGKWDPYARSVRGALSKQSYL